jgi:hypothetical protein
MAGDQTTSIAATVGQSARLGIVALGLAGVLMPRAAARNPRIALCAGADSNDRARPLPATSTPPPIWTLRTCATIRRWRIYIARDDKLSCHF